MEPPPKAIGDMIEALLGAVFIDSGCSFDATKQVRLCRWLRQAHVLVQEFSLLLCSWHLQMCRVDAACPAGNLDSIGGQRSIRISRSVKKHTWISYLATSKCIVLNIRVLEHERAVLSKSSGVGKFEVLQLLVFCQRR